MLTYQFTIIVLCEIWLTPDIDYGFDLDGYGCINNYRNKFGGGLKVFYSNDYTVKIIDGMTFMSELMEVLTFSLVVAGVKYIVVAVYRPPRANPNSFIETFFDTIIDKINSQDRVLVVGDINLNLFNPLKLNYIDNFINNFLAYSYFPLITRPTRVFTSASDRQSVTLLDQIMSNFIPTGIKFSGILEYNLTDHYPVYYLFKAKNKLSRRKFKYRLVNNTNIESFVNSISNCSFDEIYNVENVNDSFEKFYLTLRDTYNDKFPIKRKIIRGTAINAPWVDYRLRSCIKKRYRLFNSYRRGCISKRAFMTYCNLLRIVTNKMKRLYFREKFRTCNSTKDSWNNINKLLKRDKRNDEIDLKANNVGVPCDEVAQRFNDYFTHVASSLVANIPTNINWNYFNSISRVFESCFFLPTSYNEIKLILDSFANKGNSMHNIKPEILRRIKDMIIPHMVFFYNRSVLEGIYPDLLKVARVVPIFKAGDRCEISNYRPISNLLTVNKIFETLTNNRISSFLDKHKIISDRQFGFCKRSSATLAIFSLVTDVLKTFNQKLYTVAIFLDLRKAFDTVNVNILMHKLELYGFRGNVNDLIKSYLSSRKQYVDVNGRVSNCNDVTIGLPQGSVLGPQLFKIFINDLTKINPGKSILSADDAVLYVTDSCLDSCLSKLNLLIKNLSGWILENKLTVNVDKTKLMIFSPRQIHNLPVIYYNGIVIEWVKDIEYLGITIDENLSFVPHVKKVNKKLSQLGGVFYSMKHFLPRNTLLNIFYSLVYGALTQNIIIWGGISETHIRGIRVRLNNILRSILNVGVRDLNTNTLYKTLDILNYDDTYKLFLLKFIHFCLYQRPDIFQEHFSGLMPNDRYPTRNNKINLPQVRRDNEKQSTIFNCCNVINELDTEFLEFQNKKTLNKRFKLKCINSY